MDKPTDDKGIAHIHGSDGNDGDYEFTILPPAELDPRSNQTPLPDIDPDNPDTEHECPPRLPEDFDAEAFLRSLFPAGQPWAETERRITRLERIILYNSGRTEAITKGEYEQHILDLVGEMEDE